MSVSDISVTDNSACSRSGQSRHTPTTGGKLLGHTTEIDGVAYLGAGTKCDDLVDVVIPRIRDEFDSVLQYIRPPPYPYEIDHALAKRGRELFHSDEVGCAACHGGIRRAGRSRLAGRPQGRGDQPARPAVFPPQLRLRRLSGSADGTASTKRDSSQ